MKLRLRFSIRHKLTLIVMATSFVALIVAFTVLGVYDQFRFQAGMLEAAVTQADLLGKCSAVSLSQGDARTIEHMLKALRADPHLAGAAVFDAHGRAIASQQCAEITRPIPPVPKSGAAKFEQDFLEVFQPVHFNGQTIGTVFLRSDLSELAARKHGTLAITSVVLMIAIVVAYLLAAKLQQFISSPILGLAETVNAVAKYKNYALRADHQTNDELGELINGFNEMLSQIQERDAALQIAKSELELRVFERTRALFESNERLTSEVANHKLARDESEQLRGQLEAAFEHLQREVLERSEVQEALRRSEERFSKAFKASPVPVALLTRQTGAFVDVNEAFAELVGQVRDVIIGCTLFDVPLWSVPETRARLEALLKEGQAMRNWECRIGSSPDKARAALLSAESLMLGTEPCILLMVEDISDRVNLELRLRHAQKMEAIGQLASGVAHDFNNLLTIIQGHTELVIATQANTGKGRDALQKVLNASHRAAQLTRQLLTFSRKQVVQLKTLDLNQVVTNITVMLGPLLGEGIRLAWKPAPDLPPIEADVGMIEQVIINLAVNARDAMSRGGDLILHTQVLEVDEYHVRCQPEARAGRFACLLVSDTGSGMDPETLAHIFEPFFTTKGIGKGTGLGLATVYGIVKQHQGWVEVASQVDVGTTFRIFLPVAVSSSLPAETSSDLDDAIGGHETILLVEDEAGLRELATEILHGFGYRVLEAGHGKEALDLWRNSERKPDLLLTDMMMPEGMTGRELADQLRAASPTLRVVYTSGYSTELFGGDLDLGQRAAFLPKPYTSRSLAKVVRDCLDD